MLTQWATFRTHCEICQKRSLWKDMTSLSLPNIQKLYLAVCLGRGVKWYRERCRHWDMTSTIEFFLNNIIDIKTLVIEIFIYFTVYIIILEDGWIGKVSKSLEWKKNYCYNFIIIFFLIHNVVILKYCIIRNKGYNCQNNFIVFQ